MRKHRSSPLPSSLLLLHIVLCTSYIGQVSSWNIGSPTLQSQPQRQPQRHPLQSRARGQSTDNSLSIAPTTPRKSHQSLLWAEASSSSAPRSSSSSSLLSTTGTFLSSLWSKASSFRKKNEFVIGMVLAVMMAKAFPMVCSVVQQKALHVEKGFYHTSMTVMTKDSLSCGSSLLLDPPFCTAHSFFGVTLVHLLDAPLFCTVLFHSIPFHPINHKHRPERAAAIYIPSCSLASLVSRSSFSCPVCLSSYPNSQTHLPR